MQFKYKQEILEMNSEKHLQKAGDNSQQYQANTIIVQNGIDEKRAREICTEMFEIARKDLTAEAYTTACRRVSEFENDLIPKMQKLEGALDYFGDPSFQFLITNAHKTAASTDRPADYSLLSELLIHRVQRGENRATVAGISRAVEIVDKISDEALLALSVAFAILQYGPVSGNISQGLDVLNGLFEKLCYNDLPLGIEWIDHLDVLDAVRMSNLGGFKKLEDYYSEKMSGYCVAGIKKDSENYAKALQLLEEVALPKDLLVDNELNAEYVRLLVVTEKAIEKLQLSQQVNLSGNIITIPVALTTEQKNKLYEIYSLYTKETNVLNLIKQRFKEELLNRQHLNKILNWWNSIPSSFSITGVGKVLAHANTKRCDNTLPDLN